MNKNVSTLKIKESFEKILSNFEVCTESTDGLQLGINIIMYISMA